MKWKKPCPVSISNISYLADPQEVGLASLGHGLRVLIYEKKGLPIVVAKERCSASLFQFLDQKALTLNGGTREINTNDDVIEH